MNNKVWSIFTGLCVLMMLTVCAVPASAQSQEVKAKPPMFTYVANWQIPREKWPDLEAQAGRMNEVLEKAMADGVIIGYGHDENLVHAPDGSTHDNWWSAMSMAGLVKMLDQVRGASTAGNSTLTVATKHWDNIYVSRYYNWKPGGYKGGYTRVSTYKLKADAPDNAIDHIAQHMVVPELDKQIADGTLLEYEIDTEAVHTESPGTFAIVYVTPTAEDLDKVHAAISDQIKALPFSGQAFDAITDYTAHRDYMMKGDGAYK